MTDKNEKPKQFHVEVVALATHRTDFEVLFAERIEAAYQRLNDTALMDNMVIVRQDQAFTSFVYPDGETAGLCMVLTVQRVNRRDLQEMQMREAIGQRPTQMGRG